MFEQGQILNGCYQILRSLGNGGTSSVYLSYHLRLRKYVVIKQLRGRFTDPILLRTEVDILKDLHHPNLPQVYDFFQENDVVYTVMDFVDGADLEAYRISGTPLQEGALKLYLRQIADVLSYLHGQHRPVIHSDIKPGNIIIDRSGDAILIDFNTSIGAAQYDLLGLTFPYASPEQIQLARYRACYQEAPFVLDPRTDIYSLGATFYELITGIQPIPGVRPTPLHSMGITHYSREFLMLIDRMMEPDREKRIQSAKKLVAAIDRLEKDPWRHLAMRSISFIVSAVLVASGIYCCIRGAKLGTMETYRRHYNEAVACVDQGDLDRAEAYCDAILDSEQLQAYLAEHSQERAGFYHVLGDVHYYRGQYSTAAAYYMYALDSGGDTGVRDGYLRDAAIAYAQAGELATARSLLGSAQASKAPADDLLLISVAIDGRSGDIQRCIQGAETLLARSDDSDICLRAVMCVASVLQDPDEKIRWLDIARGYEDNKTIRRSIAGAYAQKAQSSSGEEQKTALREATALYAQLCDSIYATSADRINYSVVLRMQGDHQTAQQVLLIAQQNDPGNYRVLMELCFVYYEMGNDSQAARYCQEALDGWKVDNDPDKLSATSDQIQLLRDIAKRYGIGGD